MLPKIKEFQCKMRAAGIHSAMLTSIKTQQYLTGFFASSVTLVSEEEVVYYTDFRTIEAAEKHFSNSDIRVGRCDGNYTAVVTDFIKSHSLRELAVENRELTHAQFEMYKSSLPCHLSYLDGIINNMRNIKDQNEIDNIIKSQRIVETSLHQFLPMIHEGMSEKELVAELIYLFYKNGAEGLAFPVIILTGCNTSLPHGIPGDRRLCLGDFITMDIGVKMNGYCSDMTRTFAFGYATDEMKEVYATVLSAQLAGIAATVAGKCGDDIDTAARSIIDNTKWKGLFGHNLGHSVGMDCHDGMQISIDSRDIITDGNVITCEPGIYIPEKFGVRIEDMLLLQNGKVINLTNFSKELIIL